MSNTTLKSKERFILWRIMDILEKIFCTLPVVFMTVVVFAAVICRYIFRRPFGWSEEFTMVCMMWCVFGAAPYAFYTGLNVGVTFLVDCFKGKARQIVQLVIYLATILFLLALAYASTLTAINVLGKFTNAAHIPQIIPYSALPYGCIMSALRLAELFCDEIHRMKFENTEGNITAINNEKD